MNIFENAFWIWTKKQRVNQYVCFRKEFKNTPVIQNETIHISADSDFVIYINGNWAGAGQFSDWPDKKTWSSFDISSFLCSGTNTVAILAYWRGEDFFTYETGTPGIIVRLGNLVTDESWKCIEQPAFQSGPISKTTMQLGFNFSYDARFETNWQEKEFDCSSWQNAQKVQREFPIAKRPMAPLKILPPVPATIIKQGVFMTSSKSGTTVAEKMAQRELVPEKKAEQHFPIEIKKTQNSFLLIDLVQEQAGVLNFELEATAGTILDIAHGEHIEDGRVRMHIGERNFADRYICREGTNSFIMPFRRLGCRYLELHITGKKTVKIKYFSISPSELELSNSATFHSNDKTLDKLYDYAVNTMRLCMHEHYEDCPWREQALYGYDSRMQMLFGYPIWGNYDFAATSIKLLEGGKRSDGLLEMCSPAKRMPMTIPIFSFAWGTQLWEHYLHGGENSLLVDSLCTLESLVESQYKNLDPQTGLYHIPVDPELWHFYEWTPGMTSHGFTRDFHAAFNLYYLELLKNTAKIKKVLGKQTNKLEKRTAELTKALASFRYSETGDYAAVLTSSGELKGKYECIQILMLYHGISKGDKAIKLIDRIFQGKHKKMMAGSLMYFAEAIFASGPYARTQAWNTIISRLSPMLNKGSGTLWEMYDGATAFEEAGSLCHGWSGLPAWLCHTWVLGIRALEPGFRKFSVAPFPADLTRARGEVITPAGRISLKWELKNGKPFLELSHPAELQPVFSPLPEMPFSPELDVKITIV